MPRKSPRAPTKRVVKTKIRVDPIAEAREAISDTKVANVYALSDEEVFSHIVDVVSTQSIALDAKIGGGVPCGRITEMYADEGIGKSTLAAHMMASVQQEGGLAFYIDTEETADRTYLKSLGVDIEKLQIIQFKRGSTTIENVFEIIAALITRHQDKFPDVKVIIVWDSVAATPSLAELKAEEIGSSHAAKPAKSIKSGLRRITQFLAGTKMALVCINHMYTVIGGYGPGPSKKIPYGGRALAMMSTLRLKLFPLETIKDSSGVVLGRKIGVSIEKIKNGVTWKQVAEVAILHGVGIDNIYTLFDVLKKEGIIRVGGAWNYLQFEGEEQLAWQKGFQGLGTLCAQRPELFNRLLAVYQALDKPAALPEGGATSEA